MELSSLLLETRLSIGEFLQMRPGDVIPIHLPEFSTVFAEDVPVFRARYGQNNGRNAVRFHAPTGRREIRLSPDLIPENSLA